MTISPAFSADPELIERVRENLAAVRGRIAVAGGDAERIRVVAVTKSFGPEAVHAAVRAGLMTLGENYLGELEAKRAVLGEIGVRWHFLGALQSNKIRRAARAADVLCGVSRRKELTSIANASPGASIYVEVETTGLATRNGAPVDDVGALVDEGRRLGLDVRGLMTVAPPDEAGTRRAFALTNGLADQLGVAERSMGMSDDLELACQYGTTEVRLGRALFGPRPVPRRA